MYILAYAYCIPGSILFKNPGIWGDNGAHTQEQVTHSTAYCFVSFECCAMADITYCKSKQNLLSKTKHF